MAKEIERKFLVQAIPDVILEHAMDIEQTYLATGEEEIRVRKCVVENETTYTHTIKAGSGLIREETEKTIMESTYTQLLEGSVRKPLRKTRYDVKEDGKIFSLDIYNNAAQWNLMTVEIEFGSLEEAEAFVPPSWFGKEVTLDKSYKNQSLWKQIQ